MDTVGAGDVYHGAYLFAIAKGMSPADSAQFANAVAAIKCTSIGGRSGIPNYEMTMQFMQTGSCDRTLIEQNRQLYERFCENGVSLQTVRPRVCGAALFFARSAPQRKVQFSLPFALFSPWKLWYNEPAAEVRGQSGPRPVNTEGLK